MKIQPLLPDTFSFGNFRIVLKIKRKQFLSSQILKIAFMSLFLILATSTNAFELPTQKIQQTKTQTTQNVATQQEDDEEVYKFLKSKPDPNLLPMMFDLKDGYILKLKKVDYSTGEVIVDFFKENSIEHVGTYNFIHNKIKLGGMPSKTEITNSLKQIKTQLLERDQHSEYRKVQRRDSDIDFAEFILACLVFNDEIIDVERSILENRVKLKSSYQASFNLETFDDKILIFYLSIFSNIDEVLLKINTYILGIVVPISAMFLLLKRITTLLGNKHDPHDYWASGIFALALIYLFYIINSTIPVGEDKQISRTNYQNFFGSGIQKSVEFATKITEVFGETYINVQRKNSGLLSKEEVERITVEQLSIDKQLVQYNSLLSRCKNAVDDLIFKEDGYSYRVKEGISKIAVLKPEYRRGWISLDLCDFAEQRVKFLQDRKVENERILTSYNQSLNNRLTQNQLTQLANMQVKNIEDYGFFALPLIASNNMFAENLDMYSSNVKSQAQLEEARKESNVKEGMKKGVITDSAVADVVETLPYLMLPAAGTVATTINGTIGTATSSLEKIPVVGKFVSGAKQVVSYGTTIYLYSYLVKYLPLATLVIASFLVMAYWLLSIVIYMFISPFLIVWIAINEESAIKKFLVKGISLSTRPITLAISIILCIVFLDLFASITNLLLDEQFANFFNVTMGQDKLSVAYNFSDFGLFFVKGFFALAISIIGVVLSFYITFNGVDIMLKFLGISEDMGDAQGVIGKEVDNRGGQYSRPMVS